MSLFKDYLEERYEETDFPLQTISDNFEAMMSDCGREILKDKDGFMCYELRGDAVICYDLYVKPEARGHTKAKELHDKVISEALKAGKRVAISFVELAGKDHFKGIKALKFYGLEPLFKTVDSFVFIKGI